MSAQSLTTSIRVGVPLQVWHAEFTLELDRDLPLLEETILKLVFAGVRNLGRIGELLGLEQDQVLDEAIITLLSREAIAIEDQGIKITPIGRNILDRAVTRELQKQDVQIMRDPYTRELLWMPEEQLMRWTRNARRQSLHLISPRRDETGWTELHLKSQHDKIQRLLDLEGLHGETEEQVRLMKNRNRQLVSIKPLKRDTLYRLATLEVTHHPDEERLSWQLRLGEGPHPCQKDLKRLEENGVVDVLPLERWSGEPISAEMEEIGKLLENAQGSAETLRTLRDEAFAQVVYTAQRHLLVVSPFLLYGKPDWILLDALKNAAQETKSLKLSIIQTVDPLVPRDEEQYRKAQQEVSEQLRALQDSIPRRLQIKQSGTSHMSLVISESRACWSTVTLLTDEARHGYGIRHEVQSELTQQSQLKTLTQQIHETLKLAKW